MFETYFSLNGCDRAENYGLENLVHAAEARLCSDVGVQPLF